MGKTNYITLNDDFSGLIRHTFQIQGCTEELHG